MVVSSSSKITEGLKNSKFFGADFWGKSWECEMKK